MICHKCGYVQKDAVLCKKCGFSIKADQSYTMNLTWEGRILRLRYQGKKWLLDMADQSVRLIIMICLTLVGGLAVLYGCTALWGLYLSTQVGQKFIQSQPAITASIEGILSTDPVSLAFRLTLTALVICLIIGSFSQLFSLTKYLYYTRNFLGRILFWGIPCTAAMFYYVMENFANMSRETAVFLSLGPSLLIFQSCFNFTSKLLPELISYLKLSIEMAKNLINRPEE